MPGTGAAAHHEKATYDRFGRPFQHFDASRTEARFDFNGTRRAYNANGHLERLQDAEGTFDGQGRFTPKVVYRTVTAMDARGNVTAETLGNGVRRAHAYDGRTGRLLGIESGRSSATDLQDLAYQWDALGNLKSRTSGEGASALVETFGHDGLNRLTSRRAGAGPVQSTTYDGYGNVRSRTGAGTYAYGADSGASGRPHAAASVTRNGATVTHAYDATAASRPPATGGPSPTPPSARPGPSPGTAARQRSPTAPTAPGSGARTPTAATTPPPPFTWAMSSESPIPTPR